MDGAKRIALSLTMILATSSSLWAQVHLSWVTDMSQAQQLAQQNRRLILMHFWSPNCPPCLRLEQRVLKRPDVIRAVETNYVPLKINVSENRRLAARYNVTQWPTDVIVTTSGKELFRGVSSQDPIRYTATLDQVAAHARLNMPAPAATANLSEAGPTGRGDIAQTSGYETPVESQATRSPGHDALLCHGSSADGTDSAHQSPDNVGRSTVTNPAQAYGGSFQLPDARQSASADPRSNNALPPRQPQMKTNPYALNRPTHQDTGGAAHEVANRTWQPSPAPSHQSPAGATQWSAERGTPTLEEGRQTANNDQPPARQRSLDPTSPETQPAPGLENYCPVTLVEREQWVKGDPRWGAIHRGRLYLFTGPEEQQRFLQDFDKYAPVLSGCDPVIYAEQGELADGKRAHGVFFHNRVFLFANENSLQRFWTNPERFAGVAVAEQQQAASSQRR